MPTSHLRSRKKCLKKRRDDISIVVLFFSFNYLNEFWWQSTEICLFKLAKIPPGLCVIDPLMVVVLEKPIVRYVLRASLELLVSWAPQLPATLHWIRMWCDVDATYCLSDSQRRGWLSCSSFPILCISDLSLPTCCKVAKKSVPRGQRVHMQLIAFWTWFLNCTLSWVFCGISGNHQTDNVFTKYSQECYRVKYFIVTIQSHSNWHVL